MSALSFAKCPEVKHVSMHLFEAPVPKDAWVGEPPRFKIWTALYVRIGCDTIELRTYATDHFRERTIFYLDKTRNIEHEIAYNVWSQLAGVHIDMLFVTPDIEVMVKPNAGAQRTMIERIACEYTL